MTCKPKEAVVNLYNYNVSVTSVLVVKECHRTQAFIITDLAPAIGTFTFYSLDQMLMSARMFSPK